MTQHHSARTQFMPFYGYPPQQIEADGSPTWLVRGANFVVGYTDGREGTVLERQRQPDEYMVVTPTVGASLEAGGEAIEAAAEGLTIVPPGRSRITLQGDGPLIRVFSSRAVDLACACSNRDAYKGIAPGIAPLEPWPEPHGGYRLRSYRATDYTKPGSNLRVFRSTNLMINMLVKREVSRDTRKLSPHSHADFEQGSLAISGTYVHHCRYPWTADLSAWQDDEHVVVRSPSMMIVPPKVIHTSHNIGDQTGWLIDIFAPPRVDFSLCPGVVCNTNDYPMPHLPENVLAAARAAKE